MQVGSVELANPIMTASGTAGYGDEFAAYFDLASIGAVVTKSIAAFEWAGQSRPAGARHPAGDDQRRRTAGPRRARRGSITTCPRLMRTGATVVCSIWGRSVAEFAAAADLLAAAPPGVVAVEVNLSCPNLEGRGQHVRPRRRRRRRR